MATDRDFQAYLKTPAPHSGDRRRGLEPKADRPGPAAAEIEFLDAIREYKRASGRMFPTWSEVLEVARGLGYRKSDGPSTGP